MSPISVKITSKGQTTIPKEIRELLKSDVIEFEVVEGNVVLKPIRSIGRSLNQYAKIYAPLKDIRGRVWEEVVRERSGKKTA